MGTTRVVHCKKEPYDVYIGRPSIWGNHYIVGKDGTRIEVVEKYRQWLLGDEQATALLDKLGSLKGKTLGCWCHPLACHGDILAELADEI